ncbi:MAG: hypothetical protein Q4G03_03640 [Planctomycetia bacterium]|nr:hypothetical protein [Planctomycetia bacterium]
MYPRRLAQLILSVSIILCARITLAQTDVSLLETIQRTANELSVFPIDVVLGNSTEMYSQWDLRYDVRYSQFRQLYLTLLTAELATKGEALECLERLEEMTAKERALALAALYVYDRNHTSPFNLNVVERFHPDKRVELGEPLNDSERTQFIDALKRYTSSNEVCFVKETEASLQEWEADFRRQFLLFHSILRFTDHATGVRGVPLFYRNFMTHNTSLRFLYALLVLETVNDELPVYELSYLGKTLPTIRLKRDLTSPSEKIFPRALLNDVFRKSQSDVLERANTSESFFEVIIMREFLRTQYSYTRLHGSEQKLGRCGDSSSERIELGTIAQQILEAISHEQAPITKERIQSVKDVATVEDAPTVKPISSGDEKETFLTFVRRIAPTLTFLNPTLVIDRPEKICAPNQPELYVLFTEDFYYDFEAIYNLRYSFYSPFYTFCKRVENATALELNNAFDCLDELNDKEKALVLIALTYYVIQYERSESYGKDVCAIDKERLVKRLKASADSKEVLFHLPALFQLPRLDEKEWEKNFRNDILLLQGLLGAHNPFIRMGCAPEELTQVCDETSCRFLYALAAWELYSDLCTDSLPPIDDNVVAKASDFQKTLQDSKRIIDLTDVNDKTPDESQTHLSGECQIQLDVMREYLLTQFSCSRLAGNFPKDAVGTLNDNIPNYLQSFEYIALLLLRCFDNEEEKRDPVGYRERKLQEERQLREKIKS